ncbi:uncharacterized protein LOC124381177 [Silurus meridionalis]|uniref:uncharacterized protein LOC124381177 n=1 Tax=Silurus meridionalis TaxID=175797 RepID=UPI001EEAF1A7|nr:uncharacterized protein LOC124381177 [Silurus meridionalis]
MFLFEQKMENSLSPMRFYLGICIFSLQWIISHPRLVNVALGGIATQSSTGAPYYANKAIDGNRASNILSSSCTHTNNEYNPWWRVDLLDAYQINNIIVTNRGDCCPERLNGAEIQRECVIIPSIPAGASVNYTCNMKGRYVNVIIPNIVQVLTLCEVEVYAVPVPIKKKTFLRFKFNSSEDLKNSTTRDKIFQKVCLCKNVYCIVSVLGHIILLNEAIREYRFHERVYMVCNKAYVNGKFPHPPGHSRNVNENVIHQTRPLSSIAPWSSSDTHIKSVNVQSPVFQVRWTKEPELEIGMAKATPLHFSPYRTASRSSRESLLGWSPPPPGGPLVAGQTMIRGPGSPPWEIPISGDLLSQVVETILQSRGCMPQDGACLVHGAINCPVVSVLEFLQEQFARGFALSTLKVGEFYTVFPLVLFILECCWKLSKSVMFLFEQKMENSLSPMRFYLGICIFSLQWIISHPRLVNVALGGIATQSSTGAPYYAHNAIDGNRASNILSSSCTHTNNEYNPWWRVDLLDAYHIFNIIVTNRGDCCSQRLNGAEIHVGYSLLNNGNNNPRCVIIPSIPAGGSVNYTCNMKGRYVNVIIPNIVQALTLCEVEVYAVPVPIKKRTFLRFKFNSSEDLKNSTTRDKLLQKIESVNVQSPVFQMCWTKEPELEIGKKF